MVVVTFTSWAKRISNCHQVIQSILNNTVQPDMIYLNLSLQEFPNRYKDLPNDLIELSFNNPIVKINWVDGPNSKSMKKVFPILKYLDDDDLIINIDDDQILPKDLIKNRIQEFHANYDRFAISSSTNPKWHLNFPLYDRKYNVMGAASIFQKKMLNGWEKIISDEIVKTYNDDMVYTLLFLSNGYNTIPTEMDARQMGVVKYQVLDQTYAMGKSHQYQTNDKTIDIFVKQFNKVMPYTFEQSMFNLVLFDSYDVAGDNAEYFYRKIRKDYPWVNMTFAISKTSKDWSRLAKDGFNLYPFEGKHLINLFDNATYILWSKDVVYRNAASLVKTFKNKSIFLQHGVINRANDIGFYFRSCLNSSAKYIVCSSEDEKQFVTSISRGGINPIVTGLCRWDILGEKNEMRNRSGDKIKQIFISFHWRHTSINLSEYNFITSKYLAGINALLNSPELQKLSQEGIRIVFRPHAKLLKWKKWFKVPPYVVMDIDTPFQDIMVNSDMLVTDFSSNSFEFAYMNKPTLFYLPDGDYIKTFNQYHVDELLKYPHIFKCETIEQIYARTKKFFNESSKFDFADKMYKYVDMNNSRRLLEFLWANHYMQGFEVNQSGG